MAQLEIRIKMKGDRIAEGEELRVRRRFEGEIERRGIGRDLGGGSGLGPMDIGVEVSDASLAKSKLRALAEELGIDEGLIIEECVESKESVSAGKEIAEEPKAEELFGKVLCSYTRAQAIEDGVLIDVSEMAREAGIIFPVALTSTVYGRFVEVPVGLEGVQDEAGRLWDIVSMLRVAILRAGAGSSEVSVELRVQNDRRGPKLVRLKALCGPGDQGEPVITIMLPEED